MKTDRAKELFRILAARKVGREQAGGGPFCSRPHFSRGSNVKKLFRAVRFHSARTGTLATQAENMVEFRYFESLGETIKFKDIADSK